MQVSTPLFQTTVAGASQTVAHAVSLTLPLTRTNLCPNPSFEVSTASWAASGATIAQSSTRAVSGTKSLLVTWNNGLAAQAGTVGFTVATQPGQVYTISAQAWSVSATPPVQFTAAGITGSGAPTVITGAWTQVAYTFTALTSSTTIQLVNATGTTSAGLTTYLDAVLLETAPQPNAYFDGDTTDAAWTGTTGLSISVLNTAFAAPTVRTNLCQNPSFEAGLTSWTAGGSEPPTLTQSSTVMYSSVSSMRLAWQNTVTLFDGAYLTAANITIGQAYTISAWVYVPAGSVPVAVAASGLGVGHSSTVNDQWTRISHTVTATATTIGISVSSLSSFGGMAGKFTYVDAVLVEQSATAGAYFDGDTTNGTWTGTAGLSTSKLAVTAYSDVGVTVESVTVDRQTTTDMPDGTRLVTGYPAASATIVLSGLIDQTPGASKTIAWLLNPSESTSPMFRKTALNSPVSIQTGLYLPGSTTPETYTIFTGLVDDYTVDMQTGTVTLTCLDQRNLFTTVPTLPVGAYSSIDPSNGLKAQLFTSGWVLNYLCESIGRYDSPPLRTTALLRQTNHGGAWPETTPNATTYVKSQLGPDWVAGKFSNQVPTNFYTKLDDVNSTGVLKNVGSSGNSWFMECWIQSPSSNPAAVYPNFALLNTLNGTNTSVQFGAQGLGLGAPLDLFATVSISGTSIVINPATLTVPADDAWHYVAFAFHFTSTTGFSTTFYVDGATETATGTAGAAVPASDVVTQLITYALVPSESVQVTNETGTPAANTTFTPSQFADLDPSLNQLTVVPDVTGQDAWSVLQAIAEAEGGVVGFDERGVFIFINRATLKSRLSTRTITPTYSLKTLQQEVGNSTVRNRIQIPVNTLQVQTPQVVWSATSVIQVSGNSTYTTVATTDTPIVALPSTCNVIPTGGAVAFSGYRAARNADGTGGAVANLTMTVSQINSTTVGISIRNPNPYVVYLCSPSGAGYPAASNGQPALVLFARPVSPTSSVVDSTTALTSGGTVVDVQFPAAADGGAKLSVYGEQLLGMQANQWSQSTSFATDFANDLLADLYKPRPLWRSVGVVPDPTAQLTDRMTVTDPDTTKVTDDAVVFGVHFTASATDWSQTLDLRAVSTPGGWLLGVVGRSELGVNTYV